MLHNQFGGRSNASCLDTALALQHNIFEARRNIRGFFDHVNHDRMIHILWKKDFPKEICKWVKSFLSYRTIHVQLDDYTSPRLNLKVGVPQGSPVSPSLTCLYTSEVLEPFNANPILSGLDIPCGACAYIDDFGFLAISDSLHDNTAILKASMTKAVSLFGSIGMSLDPDKLDLMHFSWRTRPKGTPDRSPPLVTKIGDLPITLHVPPVIRWLGFYLDRKLMFNRHVEIMCARVNNVVTGLQVLGNTIKGMDQVHLHLLFKTCVVPVLTYGCQLWSTERSPWTGLTRKLQVVQNNAMRRIAWAFRTTPVNLLPLLTSIPPMSVTICKLCDNAATRLFRLPHATEVSHQLPASFFIEGDKPNPLVHHPFPCPSPNQKPQNRSNLTSLAMSLDPNTERSDPYHSHNTPYAPAASSYLFAGRLFFKHKPCHKDDKKSLVAEQNILITQLSLKEDSLIVFTDSS